MHVKHGKKAQSLMRPTACTYTEANAASAQLRPELGQSNCSLVYATNYFSASALKTASAASL